MRPQTETPSLPVRCPPPHAVAQTKRRPNTRRRPELSESYGSAGPDPDMPDVLTAVVGYGRGGPAAPPIHQNAIHWIDIHQNDGNATRRQDRRESPGSLT